VAFPTEPATMVPAGYGVPWAAVWQTPQVLSQELLESSLCPTKKKATTTKNVKTGSTIKMRTTTKTANATKVGLNWAALPSAMSTTAAGKEAKSSFKRKVASSFIHHDGSSLLTEDDVDVKTTRGEMRIKSNCPWHDCKMNIKQKNSSLNHCTGHDKDNEEESMEGKCQCDCTCKFIRNNVIESDPGMSPRSHMRV
jgi:hypothetical protein